MNQHIETWIDAYLDGELNEKQINKFEKHLEKCPECLAVLEEREKLSSLLQMYSLPETKKNTEQFVHDVKMLLPREQKNSANKLWAGWVWLVFSVFLLVVLLFTQAINLISNLLIVVPGVDRVIDQVAVAPNFMQTVAPWVKLFFGQWFTFSGWGFFYSSLQFTSIALTIVMSLVYFSSMAFWWVNHHNQQYFSE